MRLTALALLVVLTGCGTTKKDTAPPDRGPAATTAAASAPTTPGVTVEPAVYPTTDSFRVEGHKWFDCNQSVVDQHDGYDFSSVSTSGSASCDDAVHVFVALAEQVERKQKAGQDCFPGYCTAGNPRPTDVAGYHCHAKEFGDVSIDRFITCQKGDRFVGASVADDE